MRERSTLALSIALLGGLAAGSYWLAEQARLTVPSTGTARHEPDYFVEKFLLTRMDEQGKGRYTISAARLVHFPDDDTSDLTTPRLVSLAPERPLINMRADKAMISSDGVEVQLIGNVEIHRAAGGADAALRMRTPFLLVYPEQDIARTDRDVEMVRGDSIVTGRGLEFDNGKRVATLNPKNVPGNRVHAVIAPKKSKPSP